MHQLWLIPVFPLAGFAINGLIGRKSGKNVVNAIAVGSVLLSFLWVLKALSAMGLWGAGMPEEAHVERYFTWIQSGNLNIGFDLAVDRLGAVMLLVVTGIGGLIHIYATGYMHDDNAFWRFFAYLNLFTAAMLILVLGDSLLLLFVGWEGVGLCSYALIGFWYQDHANARAGNKAFIVNRIGDFGFVLDVFAFLVARCPGPWHADFPRNGQMGCDTAKPDDLGCSRDHPCYPFTFRRGDR